MASLGAQGPRDHGTSDFSHHELLPFVEGDRENTVLLLTILVSALSVSDNNIISILSNLDNWVNILWTNMESKLYPGI